VEVRSGVEMPLALLVLVGFALVAFLFYGGATVEKVTQATIAHDRLNSIQAAVAAPAPPPPVTSEAIFAAQPVKTPRESELLAKIEPAARAARAESLPKKKQVIRQQPVVQQQQQLYDRFSIKGY
jgi:hypothetical protein